MQLLEGVKIKSLTKFFDERGYFSELIRKDWSNIIVEEIVQANFSYSYPGIIRAWHRHQRGQIDYFICLHGTIKICVYDEDTEELNEIIATGSDLKIVRVPGEYWHGFKAVGHEPAWLVYFVNKLYDYQSPDEERRPWDDSSIMPTSINGKEDDPRVGKPWDWNYPPHK